MPGVNERLGTEPMVAGAAHCAGTTSYILLQCHSVALLDASALGGFATDLSDESQVLMPQNLGAILHGQPSVSTYTPNKTSSKIVLSLSPRHPSPQNPPLAVQTP